MGLKGTVDQPHDVAMSSRGAMSSKEAVNNPGLYADKGQ